MSLMRISKALRLIPDADLPRVDARSWFITYRDTDDTLKLTDVIEAVEAEKRGRK